MISDHSLVSLSIKVQTLIKPLTRWYLNTSLLEEPDFNSLIKIVCMLPGDEQLSRNHTISTKSVFLFPY